MGQGLSCRGSHEHGLFSAVQFGDLETVEALLERDPALLQQSTVYDRQTALHIASANGQIEVRFIHFFTSFSEFGGFFSLFVLGNKGFFFPLVFGFVEMGFGN